MILYFFLSWSTYIRQSISFDTISSTIGKNREVIGVEVVNIIFFLETLIISSFSSQFQKTNFKVLFSNNFGDISLKSINLFLCLDRLLSIDYQTPKFDSQ